jgi:hypothetical protein
MSKRFTTEDGDLKLFWGWMIVLGIVVAWALATQSPAGATVIGPPGSGVAPEYCPQEIHVVDMLAGTLGPVHQQKWYAGRNAAFAEWELPFGITQGTPVVEWTNANVDSGAVQQNAQQCWIFIIRDKTVAPGDSGGVLVMPAGGGVILNPWSAWWQAGGQNAIVSVVTHEVGHALGFAHSTEGTMGGSGHVNANEKAAARTYYEGLGFIF